VVYVKDPTAIRLRLGPDARVEHRGVNGAPHWVASRPAGGLQHVPRQAAAHLVRTLVRTERVAADREDQLAMARVATGTAPPDQAPTAVHRARAHEMPLSAPWAKPAGRGAVTSRQLRPFQASRK
jgi:hypothetical protein